MKRAMLRKQRENPWGNKQGKKAGAKAHEVTQ